MSAQEQVLGKEVYEVTEFTNDVRAGLLRAGQKELPSKYLYDAVGSAIFEVICALPEYGLTRADERLLRMHARELAADVHEPCLVAELGSGSGRKTRWLLEALSRQVATRYFPIDVSGEALRMCERELGDIEGLHIEGIEAEYEAGLQAVAARRLRGERLIVLFLGSTIGNHPSPGDAALLKAVRRYLVPGDKLLLGADLQKPLPQLLAAYDDSLGITAAFNLNMLARINRELRGNFPLKGFRHEARYNTDTECVEMHLLSLADQEVHIAAADMRVRFAEGETIRTESSHKYTAAELVWLALKSGFSCEAQWFDREWFFAENLFVAK